MNGTDGAAPEATEPPLRLGFSRGIAPSKWARRWAQASHDRPLELVPLDSHFGRKDGDGSAADVVLERTMPGEYPAGSAEPDSTRHALRLYTEAVAVVLPRDHELSEEAALGLEELSLIRLLDHPYHAATWPAAEPWSDPSWKPDDLPAALRLVATGAGGILLSLPLARHLVDKREHVILPVTEAADVLPGSVVWATWSREDDSADVQQLAGVLRGRTARSSRGTAGQEADGSDEGAGGTGSDGAAGGGPGSRPHPKKSKSPKLKPNSRGAQLAAAREKAERKKAEKRRAKRRKR